MAAANSNASNANTTVLITGASRGIGLGLVETYAKKGYRVIAAARNPAKADQLQALIKAHPKSVAAVALDVADSKSVAALPAQLAALSPAVTALDVVINNAGIFAGPGLKPLAKHTAQDFADVYRTNVIGIWEVTEVLLPLIRKSTAAAPKLVNVSSIMGSVTITSTFQFPGLAAAYRLSKSAVNELSMVQSREYNAATVAATAPAKPDAHAQHTHTNSEAVSALAGAMASGAAKSASVPPLLTVIALEPGWVDTDLGTANGTIAHKPPLTVAQSAEGIERVVSAAPVNAIASFIDYSGKAMPW